MSKIKFAEKLKIFLGIHNTFDSSFFEELTDTLIEGDVGARFAFEIVENLEKLCAKNDISDNDAILSNLFTILSPFAKEIDLVPEIGKVSIYMVLGVNGVGKTTSVAKMGSWYRTLGIDPIVLAAADTFRAAAIEQLQYHGNKTGIKVVSHQHGSDPGAVVFDAADSIRSQGGGLVIADTAGRLHNKDNLVRELQKIDRIAANKADPGCYFKILVLDATTGQNGLRQAEVFHEAVGIDAIIMTKYDSTARGGIALAAGKDLQIPIAFVGTGETYLDFARFNKKKYVEEFIGIQKK